MPRFFPSESLSLPPCLVRLPWTAAFLRPTLLLVGLILSNIMFAVMAGYVNETFSYAMASSQGDSVIGVLGCFTMLGILMYLHYQLAIRSFALIHEVPKMVSQILGVQDGERGEASHGTQVFTAVGNFSNSAGNKMAAAAMSRKGTGGPKPGGNPPPAEGKETGDDVSKLEKGGDSAAKSGTGVAKTEDKGADKGNGDEGQAPDGKRPK